MNNSKIKSALQDLIIRLQDAEKGFEKMSKEVKDPFLTGKFVRFSRERHKMHQALEAHSRIYGGDPNVKTSLLGKMHRLFLDIKFGMGADSKESIVREVRRGSTKLIEDYTKVMSEVVFSENILATLMSQKVMIENELEEINSWVENVNA